MLTAGLGYEALWEVMTGMMPVGWDDRSKSLILESDTIRMNVPDMITHE